MQVYIHLKNLRSLQIKTNHIIWDFNGTLVNDTWLFVDIMNEFLDMRDLEPIDINKYRELFDFPIEGYYEKLGFDFTKDSFDSLGKQFISKYLERMFEPELYNGALSMLMDLNSKGITQTILSASENGILNKLVEYYGISSYCDYIVGMDNFYARGKIDMAKDLIKKEGYNVDSMIVIGDTLHDYNVAQSIGSGCVLLAHGHFTRDRLSDSNAVVLDSLSELGIYINSI